MKLLLDECVPSKLKMYLPGIDYQTVPEAGLAGKKNGELLRLAELSGFQAFLTMDQGIEYQQNLQRRDIAIIIIQGRSSRLNDLLPNAAEILKAVGSLDPGQLIKTG